MTTDRKNISRRKVTAGMAWSVPAVAVAASAPAFAFTPQCPRITAGEVVKFPGGSWGGGVKHAYGFPITITNTTDATINITPGTAQIVFDGKGTGFDQVLLQGDPCKKDEVKAIDSISLAPGDSVTLYLIVNETGSSANSSGTITSTVGVSLGDTEIDLELCDEADVPAREFFDDTPPIDCKKQAEDQ